MRPSIYRWCLRLALMAGLFAAVPVAGQRVQTDRILFVSNRTGNFEIFTMAPDGSQQTNLTRSDAMEFDPVWSPDGKQIAYTVGDQGRRTADICVMNADGSGRRPLTQSPAGTLAMAPDWSPDGRQILFTTLVVSPGGDASARLHVIDAAGGASRELGDGMLGRWSPDGTRILCARATTAGDFEPYLFTMMADGSGAQRFFEGGKAMMGCWSPDGGRVVFLGEGPNDQPDIFVANADGSGQTNLTNTTDTGIIELAPNWSPDGRQIYFNRAPDGQMGQCTICVMEADGSGVQALTSGNAFDFIGSGMALFLLGEG